MLAADELQPLEGSVGDVDRHVLERRGGPREAARRADPVSAVQREVRGEAQRHAGLHDGAGERGRQLADRHDVEHEMAELVEAEVGERQQWDANAAHEREPPDERTPRESGDGGDGGATAVHGSAIGTSGSESDSHDRRAYRRPTVQ